MFQAYKHNPGSASIPDLLVASMSVSTSTGPSTKRPSRSNSISSSVITVKKSASVSSRNGPRSSLLRNRSTSPDSISRVLHSLNSSRSDFRDRVSSTENRKAANGLNVNRWSHSTSSSLSAIDADLIRKRTSSIRRSVGTGYAPNTINSASQARGSQDYKLERGSPKRSSSSSNRTSPLPGSRLAFRDSSNFNIVQDLAQPTYVKNATGVSGSTWEQSAGLNKFGETVQSLSIHYTTTNTPAVQASGSATSTERSRRLDEKQKTSYGRVGDSAKSKVRNTTSGGSPSTGKQQSPGKAPNPTESKSPKRRDMLSRALAKANEAVLLDNAQNVNAAIEAYNEACELLQQVMLRSVDIADRRKLSDIKATYSRRIAELHDFDNTFVDLMRPLPEDPPVEEYDNPEDFYQEETSSETTSIKNASAMQLPMRQESLLPEIFGGENYIHDHTMPPARNALPTTRLDAPMDEQYKPQPLSPRPPMGALTEGQTVSNVPIQKTSKPSSSDQRPSDGSAPSTWLDQYDEHSSKASSRLSSVEYDRKDGQLLQAIEAEFDAMNAAVDSAYDDEVDPEATPRNVERSMDFANPNRYDHLSGRYLDDQAESEESFLEDMTREIESTELQTHQETVAALPRTSDSSTFSGRTWGSSVASTTGTARTTLSTLAETIEPPVHGPPSSVLPEVPQSPPKIPETEVSILASRPQSSDKHVGIRDRRMSGQSTKQLKIETFARRNSLAQQMKPPTSNTQQAEEHNDPPKEVLAKTLAPAASFSSSFSSAQPSTPMLSVHSGDQTMDDSPATPALTQGGSTDDGTHTDPSPSRHGRMMPPPPGPITRKNLSSSNVGKTNLSINTVHLDANSPMTPGSAMFPNDHRIPQSAITPASSNSIGNVITSIGLGGMYLFDDHIGDLRSPRSLDMANEPAPLEPCPDSFLLRPFWLMRCLYEALAHPRGGYVSTKLFIPRDIWRVRNVKIKALEDKIAQCDLLTAALQKLAKVDTLDANAVLEELQLFENILDQVRLALSKKLGSEVGVSGSTNVFKLSPMDDSVDPLPSKPATTSSAAKTIASGWRKLRSKSSSANLTTSTNTRPEPGSHSMTMASLPMTSSSSVPTSRSYSNARARHPPPTPSGLPQLLAPHAYYVSSLARLFDAVQVLDGIARQVEDPGLKCSSSTHVGLELSVRNAAEFFAFYIIRFVMSDLLLLLDKFLKKGSEWVIS